MKKITIIVISLLMCAAVFLATSKLAEATPTQREVCCVIRNTGEGWSLYTGLHKPLGVASVSTVENTRIPGEYVIRIIYSFSATGIYTSAITPDETMARDDINLGASVGLTYADISLYHDGAPVNPADYYATGSNIWVWIKLEDN